MTDADPTTGLCEQPLTGGARTLVARVGDTVRRPAHARSAEVQALLAELRSSGFTGAPQPLGFDGRGREVVSYVEGDVPGESPYGLGDQALVAAATLVRAFHDVASRTTMAAGAETVCHGDLGPHNTVFRTGLPVAIIDWDAGVGPGRRADDFAHAAWCFADLLEDAVPVGEQARRLAVMCAAYPGMTPAIVVVELAARFGRARAVHAAAGRDRAVAVFVDLADRLREAEGALTTVPTGRPSGS